MAKVRGKLIKKGTGKGRKVKVKLKVRTPRKHRGTRLA